MALKPIEILKDTISSVAHRITITSVVSLGSNQYQLNTANTLYLRTKKKVTIDSIEYEVVDFDINSYVTVEAVDGTDQPVSVSFFDIDVPLFVFGNPKMVSSEIVKRIKNGTIVWPYVWLVEISNTSGSLAPSTSIGLTPSFNIFFLDSNDYENWSIQEHYDNDVYVMSNYIDFVLAAIYSRKDIYNADEIDYTTTNHVNFGDYIVDQGMNERIINDNVTGVQLQIDLPIIKSSCSDVVVTANCPTITETFNGNSIENPEGSKAIVVQSDAIGTPQVGTKTTDTANQLVITVPASGGADVTTDFNDTPTGIDTPAGDNLGINVVDDDDIPVGTLETNEANLKEIRIANSNVSNSDDTYSVDVLSEQNLELPDITHTQTDGSPETLPAQTPLICDPAADAENQVNGDSKTNIPSGGSKNFVIQDSNGTPVTVTEISDSATAFVGEVATGGGGVFKYNMPQPTWNVSYNTYDEGWHNINGTYDNTITEGDKVQLLADGDFYKVQFDAEGLGHNYRFIGIDAGYYNSDDGFYYLANGTLSTRTVVFNTALYAFDRLTGLAWILGTFGPTNLVSGIASVQAYAGQGFTNYEVPFLAQLESIIDTTLAFPLTGTSSPVFNMLDNLKTTTPSVSAPTTTGWYLTNVGNINQGRAYTINDRIPVVRDARGQF